MNPLMQWLLTEGRLYSTIPELLSNLGPRLQVETGCSRIWLGTKVLHPQAAGYTWIWENNSVTEKIISYAALDTLEKIDSPAMRLSWKQSVTEIRLQSPNNDGMPDVKEIFDNGYVDFFAHGILFQGQNEGSITYSSHQHFSTAQLDLFRLLNPVINAVIEPITCRLISAKLLETYLGADAGRRVFQGEVKRGDGHSLRAVIWFSDIRGFTKMSEQLELNSLLDVINNAFEQVVTAVEANGGQVLKFIGDGVLAIFPCDNGDSEACIAARNAALQLMASLKTVHIGVGLHLGTVNYGNIGAPERLDFTVIGPDVNLAARVESQTAVFKKQILATDSLTSAGQWEEISSVQLKGVQEKIRLFSPTRE